MFNKFYKAVHIKKNTKNEINHLNATSQFSYSAIIFIIL